MALLLGEDAQRLRRERQGRGDPPRAHGHHVRGLAGGGHQGLQGGRPGGRSRARPLAQGPHHRAHPRQEPDRLRDPERASASPSTCASSIEDRRFQEMKAPLPCVLGRDIIGTPYFADLASMPHVIVAGATGAGKSVGLNVMLVSLLFRKSPADLRLLMIDPKVVELAPVRSHPAHAPAGRDRHEAGRQRAQVGRRRDGAALPALRQRRDQEHHDLQRLGGEGAPRRGAPATTACQGRGRRLRRGRGRGRRRQGRHRRRAAGEDPVHRDRGRRVRRPDDAAGQGRGGERRPPGAEGARRGHARDPGDAAAQRRRHHRHDQGELPHPHRLPRRAEGRQPHHPRRAGRRAPARAAATCWSR